MIYNANQLTSFYKVGVFNERNLSAKLQLKLKEYSNYDKVTTVAPSYLRITDKFGSISSLHFFSALAIDSGQLEITEELYLLFQWTAFSLK